MRRDTSRNLAQATEKPAAGPRFPHAKAFSDFTAKCGSPNCSSFIFLPRRPTIADLVARTTFTCHSCHAATGITTLKFAVCDALATRCQCTATQQKCGPPAQQKPPHHKPMQLLNVIAGFSGCDAAIAALRSLPVLFRQLWRAGIAATPTAFCKFDYYAGMRDDAHLRPPESLRESDIYIAGPPCQDYSSTGQGEGPAGLRGRLCLYILWCLQLFMPRVILLENVVGLHDNDKGKLLWLTIQFLQNAGYHVT